jgi:hypothetical protein
LRSVKKAATLHDPESVLGKQGLEKIGYYPRIVPHESSRARAINAFKMASAAAKEAQIDGEAESYPSAKKPSSAKRQRTE